MQIPKLFGVRRRDVDRRKGDVITAVGQHGRKVSGAIRAGLVGAKVQTGRAGMRGKTAADGSHPVVVEPKTVDGGGILGQAEKAWFGVAGLRQCVAAPTSKKPKAV